MLRRLTKSRLAALGLMMCLIVLSCALFAPLLAPHPPNEVRPADVLLPPSSRHLLGADNVGRDLLSRIIYGSRVSLFVSVVSIGIAGCVGIPLGLLAGFYGRLLDGLIMRTLDALRAFPAVLLAIFIMAALGPSIRNALIALAVVYIAGFARITRASVLSLKRQEFVESARAIGAPDRAIMLRTILPNCLSPLLVQGSLAVGGAILVESSLSFLGLGVPPPTASWGSMLSAGRGYLSLAPWFGIFPGLAIMFTVLGLNFLGDGLRDVLDPRLRQGSGG